MKAQKEAPWEEGRSTKEGTNKRGVRRKQWKAKIVEENSTEKVEEAIDTATENNEVGVIDNSFHLKIDFIP